METEQHYYPHFDGPSWQRSCTKEIIKPIHGKISGTIPKWLNGVLIRNGPGLFKFGDTAFKHVFDGMALLHRFKIEDGNVTYQCRFVQSDVYKKNTQANRIVVTDFGTASIPDPCETIFHRISSIFTRNPGNTDNTAISVYPFGDEMYALSETGVMYRVDKDSLETERKLNSTETVGIITHTAHPHVSEDGTVYNLALSFPFNKSLYHIVRFPNKQNTDENDYAMFNKAHIIATIPTRWKLYPSYMHSFGLTENYFIIVEQPLSISIPKAFLSSLLNMPVHECFQWYKDEMTRFIVISRKTGELVEEFYSNAFCYFHTINQYEDSNHIVIDICTFKDSSVLDSFYIDAIKNAHSNPNYSDMITSVPERFVLPLGEKGNNHNFTENLVTITDTTAKAYLMENGSVIIKPELICDVVCELPAINYQHFMGKKYQYFYGVSPCATAINPGTLMKVDIDNKTNLIWFQKGSYPSEPVFVPAPNAQSEDDGLILSSLIYGTDENRVGLLVLEAKTFTEIGRVEFETPTSVPRTYHGWYFPNSL